MPRTRHTCPQIAPHDGARGAKSLRSGRGSSVLSVVLIGACLGLLAPAMSAYAQEATPKPTIPRFVATAGDTIWLGDAREKIALYAGSETDTMVRLPLLTAADADGVLLYIDAARTVRRIAFVYLASRPIGAMLEQHQRDFGPASDYSSAAVPDGIRESWSWRDAETHMTFTRFTPAQHETGAVLVLTNLRP